MASELKFLSQHDAIALDTELMSDEIGFTNVQLMELAGLSCADAIRAAYPAATRALVLVGPGNNGGDAMVAARHLFHYGVRCALHVPKPKNEPHLQRLLLQCRVLGLELLTSLPAPELWAEQFDLVVDGLFGFSFDPTGGIRAPFDALIGAVNRAAPLPVVALDIPSGWHVETGNALGVGMRADVLISLTAPKLCARHFRGRHFLGGRFVPPSLAQKYALNLPPYEQQKTFVEIQ